MSGCCPARRPGGLETVPEQPAQSSRPVPFRWCPIPAGSFLMGSQDGRGFPSDGEGPVRRVSLPGFSISAYTVTNAQFADFVRDTGYRTDAERHNWSYVFVESVSDEVREHTPRAAADAPWWLPVPRAYWAQPEGPGSTILDRARNPVVHVSWSDAQAFCHWSGTRLPSEAEWECAARGGLEGALYPWGDELIPDGQHRCNIWQGDFPARNDLADGYAGTAPVDAFPPNGYGLYNVAGNVWEWCEDPFDHSEPLASSSRALRGGSFLCHESYCNRYRVAARTWNTPDTSTSNIGFRVAAIGDA